VATGGFDPHAHVIRFSPDQPVAHRSTMDHVGVIKPFDLETRRATASRMERSADLQHAHQSWQHQVS
jgi:hypothetical protein